MNIPTDLWLWLAIQIPIVVAFIVFEIIQSRSFLQHMSDADMRRTQAAAAREKEKSDRDRENNEMWKNYLQDSRQSYLIAIGEISKQATKNAEVVAEALGGLTHSVTALADTLSRHDAITIEILRSIATEIRSRKRT